MTDNPLRIFGIETSCDETAAAVVEGGQTILSNVVASQQAIHAKYGGIFPEVASRIHIEAIHPVISEAMAQAHLGWSDVDAIAVTRGPGLPGSLLVGLNVAKGLALGRGLPLVGVNHLEAHIYSVWISRHQEMPPTEMPHTMRERTLVPHETSASDDVTFPIICLIVSGGHTELVLMTDHGRYQRLGGTLDDAAGEAFDKVARLLGLPYPGGPSLEKAAAGGDPRAFAFPRAWLEGTWNFSFSGLKTAVLKQLKKRWPDIVAGVDQTPPGLPVPNLAASFQAAVVDVLVEKTAQAAEQTGARGIIVAGGVSANQTLRTAMEARAKAPVRYPPLCLCTDNAAMIAAAGHYRFLAGQRDGLEMDAMPNWRLDG